MAEFKSGRAVQAAWGSSQEMSALLWLNCSRMTLPSLTHYEMRCSGNGLKQSVLSGQIHQQVNFHNPRRAVIGRERTNSEGGTQVAAPVTIIKIIIKCVETPS